MKIGLFGGSFNPIHNDHLMLMNELLEKNAIDEIWIIPCKNHVFKKKFESANHRLNMIGLGIKEKGIKKVKINKIELESKGKNYTINTIRKLKRKYSHEFFFIVGSDILEEITTWHKYKEFLREINLIVFKRQKKGISSTKVRENIKKQGSIRGLVPKLVSEYIIKNKLYAKR